MCICIFPKSCSIKGTGRVGRIRRKVGRYDDDEELEYFWERDFPLNLQTNKKDGQTVFTTVYSLTKTEKNQLKKISKKAIVGNLKITISLGYSKGNVTISDTKNLKKKFSDNLDILRFISNKIQIEYISAIRTPDQTLAIIDSMIGAQLSILQRSEKYQKILDNIQKMQKPILEDLSEKLTHSVSAFLPQVKKIKLDTRERVERIIRDATTVYVNDGTNTRLQLKGDGIKSLMAISIIQHTAKQRATTKNIVLVIEEPESHLHPDAIHKLNEVLREISSNSQVIISTHSPLLVDRSNVSRNILVNKSHALAAQNIASIRNILGVKIADNLQSANLIILVEGVEDSRTLDIILKQKSSKIKKAIEQGIIRFDTLNGGTNLSYKISLWKNLLCDVYAFLDNDATGLKAYSEAEKKGLITLKNITFANAKGFKESELEDLIDPNSYNETIYEDSGVNLMKSNKFRNNKSKWSERVKQSFKDKSKPWNSIIEAKLKNLVAENVQRLGMKALHKKQSAPVISLISALEAYLEKNKSRL